MWVFTNNQKHLFQIDPVDFPLMFKYSWCAKRHRNGKLYIHAKLSPGLNKCTTFHRFIIKAKSGEHVDHINGDASDNRRSNLRICSTKQNRWNSKAQAGSKSGYKGVRWRNRLGGYWEVSIKAHGISYWGSVNNYDKKCLISAAKEADRLLIEHHGEFAKLNFPDKV